MLQALGQQRLRHVQLLPDQGALGAGGETVDVAAPGLLHFVETGVQRVLLAAEAGRHDQLLDHHRAGVMGIKAGALGIQRQQLLLLADLRQQVPQTVARVLQQHA
uniref:hypothetical protein n=1 Tax=Pseudomonas mohnii TaxID=395600 RepID=UPI001A1BA1BB